MPDVLKAIRVSGGREVRILRGKHAGKPELLYISCSTYTESDSAGKGIPVQKGAVEKVLGGALTWDDYDKIAEVLLDDQSVGPKVAAAARAYQARVRSCELLAFSEPWMNLLAAFELHPLQEVVFLSLRSNAITDRFGSPFQPFETQ